MTNHLLCWAKHSYPLLSTTTHFECNLLLQEISFSLWDWELIFCRNLVELSVLQLTSYTSLTPLLNPQIHLSMPIISTTHTHHPYSRITVHPNQPYHVINTEPSTIPARTNTIMTIPCALPRSRNFLFEPSKQHFVNQPAQHTPVISNAENNNLPIHFINHSDHEVVILNHSYVGAMKKVQESNQDLLPTSTSPEPVSQHNLPECFVHSNLLPNQCQQL